MKGLERVILLTDSLSNTRSLQECFFGIQEVGILPFLALAMAYSQTFS